MDEIQPHSEIQPEVEPHSEIQPHPPSDYGSHCDEDDPVLGLPLLFKSSKVQKSKPELQQAMDHFVDFLSACARAENWDDVEKTMKLLWYCSQKSNAFARLFVQANGTHVVLDLIRHGCKEPMQLVILEYSTALLLECVKIHEDSGDVVVESDIIRLLLQLLQSPASGSFVKQHIAETIRYLAGAKLLYKDVLQGAGTLEVILELLQDSTTLCDLQVLQELLWALICLADDDLVYKDLFREAGTLQALVNLLQVYQVQGFQDKAPITALIIRSLHVMTFGDDISKETLLQLGLVEALVGMLQQLVFGVRADEAAAAAPATEPGQDPAATPAPAPATAAASVAAPEQEVAAEPEQDAAAAAAAAAESKPSAAAPAPSSSKAEGAEGAAGGEQSTGGADCGTAVPAADARTAVELEPLTLLERVAVRWAFGACAESKGMEKARAEMVAHALLLPRLPLPSGWGQKALDLVKEVTGALKSLMGNSPENQEAAVRAGIVPCLVKLLHGYTVAVTWEAAEAISYMVTYKDLLISEGAVERLIYVLRDCSKALSLLAATPRALPPYTPPRVSEADNPLPMSSDPYGSSPAPKLQTALSAAAAAASGRGSSKLDGRQHTGLVATNSMFSFSDYACFCGYYVPTAAMKALLRLMTMDAGVQRRMIRAGGVAALFGLLRSEVHNPQSKLASSVVSLLSVVMDNNVHSQEEVRRVGGIEVLCQALDHAVRSGVSDVYQLKSSICGVLQKAVEGSDANKGMVRDLGGLHSLVTIMEMAAMQRGGMDVDDAEQAGGAAVAAVCAVIPGVPTNQAALNNLGAIPILAQMVVKERDPSEVMVAAIKALGLLADNNPSCQLSIAATGVVPVIMSIADAHQTHAVAAGACTTLCSVMKNNKFARDAVSNYGAVPLLTRIIRLGAASPSAAAAARALYILCSEDTEMQTLIVEAGALQAVLAILAEGPGCVATKYCLVLLATLVRHNTFTKNTARAHGALPTLLALLKGDLNHQVATLACGAIAELCDSNHGNQEALAAAGGVELLVSLLRAACGESLEGASRHKQLIEEVARGLGNLVQLHPRNKVLVREAGGVAALTSFTLMCAKDSTMHLTLASHHMLGTVKEVACAVAKLAQDSEEGQYSFATQMHFIPSLFKLLTVEDASAAVEVARALEYVAIRSSAAELDEDPFDFEMEAIKVFIKALQLGGSQSAAVTEAAGILRAIVAIAEGRLLPPHYNRSGSLRSMPSFRSSTSHGGGPDDDGGPVYIREATSGSRLQSLSSLPSPSLPTLHSAPASRQSYSGAPPSMRQSYSGGPDRTASTSGTSTVFDHSSGLAVTPGLHDPYSLHTQTSVRQPGEGAAAFQEAAKLISDGPWRAFKHQVAWMLYLLAIRSLQNRELIKHLERTNVAPLAQQLATAEAFQSTMLLALQNKATPQQPASSLAPSPHHLATNRMAAFLEGEEELQ